MEPHDVAGVVVEPASSDAATSRNASPLQLVRRALHRGTRWLARSLGRRFVAKSLGLLLVVQLASFFVIDASLDRHARAALPAQLAMSARAVDHMVDWRAQRLIESARLLASDYGFRAAVQSNDRDTIASVLSNHGARIGATEVALLGTDFMPIAQAEGNDWDVKASAPAVARLAAQANRAGGASEVAVLSGKTREMVLVPMKSPVLVGWVLMYFPLPETIADNVYELAAADLTVLARSHPADPWKVSIGRLGPSVSREIAQRPWAEADTAFPPAMIEVELGGRRYGVRPMWLTPHDPSGDSGRPQVLALMSVSIDEGVRAPSDLQLSLLATSLLGFLAFGIGSVYTARRITTPLKSLAEAVERLGSGDSTTPIRYDQHHDELRELARVFEQMRVSLAGKQEQIVQSEKLASIGQLAAGVAHEINNPIGFVFSNFGTLEDYLARLFKMLNAYKDAEPELAGTPAAQRLSRLRDEIELDYLEEDIPALMSESKDGIKRVRKIVQDLKDFSHTDTRQVWETVNLHTGLDSTLNIVNNEIKYKAEVVKEYGNLPEVECLPNELNQVYMNLLVNAAHAVPDNTRGTITVRTGSSIPTDEVWVEVADNGCGIAPANLKRIFDPFFTTKPVGKGTGLGLSLSYGIVKKHGGRIEVTSEEGRGTTFRVTVPVKRTTGPTTTE